MHKVRFNALTLNWTVEPKTPLLVKAGELPINPSLPDMRFVRTEVAGIGETVYIPGSSLKGVFRSFAEKVLRTIDKRLACDPFGERSCAKRLEKEEKTPAVYKLSCLACRLFGNTRLKGRIVFTDAYPEGEVKLETRYGVALSRLTNAVAAGPFEIEAATSGVFKGKIQLENFEVWQVGLVALTLKAMENGFVSIGFGKNRGFGEVNPRIKLCEVEVFGQVPTDQIWGVGEFLSEEERREYGVEGGDRLEGLPKPELEESVAVFTRRVYSSQEWEKISEGALRVLKRLKLGVS